MVDIGYKHLLDQSPDIICSFDEEGRFIHVSEAVHRILGYTPQQVIGKQFNAFIAKHDLRKSYDAFADAKDGLKLTNLQNFYIHKNGTKVLLSWSAQWSPEKKILYCVGRDGTEKHLLHELELLERKIFEESVFIDFKLDVVLKNYMKGLQEIFPEMKVSILKIKNDRMWNLSSPSLPPEYVESIHGLPIGYAVGSCGTAAYTKERVIVADIKTDPLWADYKYLALDHELKSCWSQPVFNHHKKVVATFGIYYNSIRNPTKNELEVFDRSAALLSLIFAKYQKGEDLISSNERFNYVNKATNDALYDWDLENDIFKWGTSFKRVFGHSVEESLFQLKDFSALMHPDDKEKAHEAWQSFIKDKQQSKWEREFRFKKADGRYAYIKEIGHLIRNQDGSPKRMIGVLRDQSQQKAEEHRLKLMESVITNSKDAILISEVKNSINLKTEIIYANEAFCQITGYSTAEIYGKTPEILQGPETDKEELKKLAFAMKNKQVCETTIINYKKNGEKFWMNFSLSPVTDEAGDLTHWISIQRDVSDQKNREARKNLLNEIGQIFNQDINLKPTLNKVLEHLVDFGGFSLAEAWLVSSNNKQLNLTAKFSTGERFNTFYSENESVTHFVSGQGLPGAVLKSKKITIWDKIDERESYIRKNAAIKSGLKAALGLPLVHNDKVLGVLVIGTDQLKEKLSYYEHFFKELEVNLGIEIKRKQLEEEFYQFFSYAPDILCIAGPDGRFTKVNPAFSKLMGYTDEELTSQSFTNFIHKEDVESTGREYAETIGGQRQSIDFVNRYITKSGDYKWISWSSSKPFTEEGMVFAYGRDITDKKELEILLERSSKMAKIGSWELDLKENNDDLMYWSPMTREILEVPPDYELSLKRWVEFYEGESKEVVQSAIDNVIKSGEVFDLELLLHTAKGNPKWVRVIGESEWQGKRCLKIFGSFQDIHQRKMAEMDLFEAFNEKKAILESISDGFFLLDNNWVVTYWNKEAEKLLKTPKKVIINKNIWDVIPYATQLPSYKLYQTAIKKQKSIEFEEYNEPIDKWFDISAYPSEKGLSVYFKDITERKQSEELLKQSNERFEKVTEATNDAIWDWDIVNDSLYRGSGFNKIFGYEVNKILQSEEFWTDKFHPEDMPGIISSLEAVLADKNESNWTKEYRILKQDNEIATVIDRGVIIRDNKGKAIRMVGAITDVTHRRKYEESLMRLNEELSARAKELMLSNAELEQFAFVASHDLQEPLRMVTSFLTQLEKKYGDLLDEKGKKYIFFAVDGAKRMRQIILDLLEFSRVGKKIEDNEKVDVKDIINEVYLLQRKAIEEQNARIIINKLPDIQLLKAPFLQVFQNLIGNALKYSESNIPPQVIIKAKESKNFYTFSVKDNGIGIEERYFDKIFIIFQRLHINNEYSGTGMGLSIVKKIVEQHGGEIWVESKKGAGSTFHFTVKK